MIKNARIIFLTLFVLSTIAIFLLSLYAGLDFAASAVRIATYAVQSLTLFFALSFYVGNKYPIILFVGMLTAAFGELILSQRFDKLDRVDDALLDFAGTLFGFAIGAAAVAVIRKIHSNIISSNRS